MQRGVKIEGGRRYDREAVAVLPAEGRCLSITRPYAPVHPAPSLKPCRRRALLIEIPRAYLSSLRNSNTEERGLNMRETEKDKGVITGQRRADVPWDKEGSTLISTVRTRAWRPAAFVCGP